LLYSINYGWPLIVSKDLTTFKTRFGSYKYLVLLFGLTNGPASWQRFMNENFFKFLDEFLSIYLDNILIFSKTLKEHRSYVRLVLKRLRDIGIQADIDKCEFHVQKTKFLSLIISTNGIEMDPEKIQAVRD